MFDGSIGEVQRTNLKERRNQTNMTTEELQRQTLESLLVLEHLLLQLKNSCTIDLAGMKLLEGTRQLLHSLIVVNCVQNQTNNEPERA